RGGQKSDEERPSVPAPGVVRLDSAGWDRLLGRLRSRLAGDRFGLRPRPDREAGLGAEPNLGAEMGLAALPGVPAVSSSSSVPAELPLNTLGPLQEDDDSFSVTAVLEQGEDEVTTATASWRKTPFDEWWREQSR